MGAESEGSSLGWGLDVGSGDPVASEELLRVSVEDDTAWDPGREEGGVNGSRWALLRTVSLESFIGFCMCLTFSTLFCFVLSEYEA